MIKSVVNDSLWRIQKGTASLDMANRYFTSRGYGTILISPDLENYAFDMFLENEDTVSYAGADGTERNATNHAREWYRSQMKSIEGILLEPFTYSIESIWDTLQTPFDTGIADIAGSVSSALGMGSIGSAFTNKKYWKHSGYLTLSPKFRIYDTYGNGHLPQVAAMLSLYCVSDIELLSPNFVQNIGTWARDIQEASFGGAGSEEPDELSDSERLRYSLRQMLGSYFKDVDSFLKLQAAPPPMVVRIGKIFGGDEMLCTNVNFEFSREYSHAGPLWLDVTMEMTSRTIIRSGNDMGIDTETLGLGRIYLDGTPLEDYRESYSPLSETGATLQGEGTQLQSQQAQAAQPPQQ